MINKHVIFCDYFSCICEYLHISIKLTKIIAKVVVYGNLATMGINMSS